MAQVVSRRRCWKRPKGPDHSLPLETAVILLRPWATRLDQVRPAAFAAQYDLINVRPDGGGLSEADARCATAES